MKLKSRINYFDVLKTISIICVIYLHYPWISTSASSNITMLISLIAVPIFFMVNGALVLDKEIDVKKHYKRTLIYFLSLIVWKVLTLLIYLLLGQVKITDFNLYEIVLSLLSNYNLDGVPTEHLWFMYSLIKLYLIVPFVYLFIKKYKNSLKYIIIFCIAVTFMFEFADFFSLMLNKLFNVNYFDFSTIYSAYNPLSESRTLTYFLLGYYLHQKNYQKQSKPSKKIILGLVFFIGLAMLIFARYVQTGQFISGYYERINNDYTKIGTLLMSISIFIFFASQNIKFNKYFNFIGSKTINIYFIHMMIARLLLIYLLPILDIYGSKANSLKTIIVFVLSILITEVLNKNKHIKRILNLS